MRFIHLPIAVVLSAGLVGEAGGPFAAEDQKPAPSPVQEFVSAFKNSADPPSDQFYIISSRLEQQLDQEWRKGAARIARELLPMKTVFCTEEEILRLLAAISEGRDDILSAKLLLQIARARFIARGREQASVVVGQLVVEDEKADPTLVLAQMPILDEGYFAGEVGDLKRPIYFRSHGYQDLEVPLKGKEGEVVYLGRLIMKPLPKSHHASLKGKIVLDGASDVDSAAVTLSVSMGPVNTPSGGFSGRRRWPEMLSVPVSRSGEFEIGGLNPGDYDAFITAKGHVDMQKRVSLAPGQQLDVGTYRLLNSDLGLYLGMKAPETKPLAWETDYTTALKRALPEKKPLMVMMTATWCVPCKELEEKTLNNPWVRYFLSSFVVVKAYEDKEVERIYGLNGYPTIVFADSSGKLAHKCVGYMPAARFSTECAKALKAMAIKKPPEMEKLIEKKVITLE